MSYLSRDNHLEGNMYKCSMLSMPSHLICKFLVFFTFFYVHGRECDDAGPDDVPLDSESGLLSDGIEL